MALTKAGFLKLRTISANYDFPERWARWVGATRGSITLGMENLALLWREQHDVFGVQWVDPEISANCGGAASCGYIQESLPQAMRVRTTVRFTF